MGDPQAESIELTPRAAVALREAGAALIDVRREDEWAGGRLAGAVRIETNALAEAAGEIERAEPVIFYCRVGSRSLMAAEAFRRAGYEAYSLAGGIEAWVADGLPTEGGELRSSAPPAA